MTEHRDPADELDELVERADSRGRQLPPRADAVRWVYEMAIGTAIARGSVRDGRLSPESRHVVAMMLEALGVSDQERLDALEQIRRAAARPTGRVWPKRGDGRDRG